MTFAFSQKLAAEALGTAFLLAVVIGSGVMGETLAGGNIAVALLANTAATGAGLFVLITIFGPVSGAHFNPAVTLAFLLRREIAPAAAAAFIVAQIAGGLIGAGLAHAMFDLPIMQAGIKERAGAAQGLSEFIATFGLVLTIFGAVRFRPSAVAASVGLYITAAYWFTASTSFANPAVTIARSFTATFAGIRLSDAPAFIAAQILGALAAFIVARALFTPRDAAREPGYSADDDRAAPAIRSAR